jgi:predicted AAA+ superfamily ATPase
MTMNNLYSRTIADGIEKYLRTDDIIVLHGARQVGKTSLLYILESRLKQAGEATYYIDLEDSRYVKLLDAGVGEFVKHLQEEGLKPAGQRKKLYVFIDEIQYLENPSSFLKLAADHHKGIKLIVSGSSSFAIKSKFKDSLVGRTVDFEIHNLSFQEFLAFKEYRFEPGKVFTQKKIDELRNQFKEYALYGGYPKIVLTPELDKKERYLQQIIDTYVKKDIRDLANVKDLDKFNKLLEALSSQSGQLLNIAELSNTVNIAKQTVEKYLFILENTYIIRLVRPFSGNLRSELFKTPKIFFYDTGLMQMLWLRSLPKELMGNVFETSVFSELVKKYGKEAVYYWRTKDRKEIDFVLKDRKGTLPIEVKLRFEQFKPAAMTYFMTQYKGRNYKVIGLTGAPRDGHQVYPWDI